VEPTREIRQQDLDNFNLQRYYKILMAKSPYLLEKTSTDAVADAVELLRLVKAHRRGAGFPFLRGPKISPL
jgi:hypothetical protein